MAVTRDDVIKLYVAMFHRAPEGNAVDTWVQAAESEGWGLAELAQTMCAAAIEVVQSDESYASIYPEYANLDLSNLTEESVRAVIESVYEILFNKTYEDDPEGIDGWVADVIENGQPLGNAIASIVLVAEQIYNGEVEADEQAKTAAQAFMNKVEVAKYFADNVSEFNGDFEAYQQIIADVTDDPDTVNNAKQETFNNFATYEIEVSDTSVVEGNSITFTVKTSFAPVNDVTLNYKISGVSTDAYDAADPVNDLGGITGQVTIPAGETQAQFTLTPLDDGEIEGFEGFKVTLLDSSFNVLVSSDNIIIQDPEVSGRTFVLTNSYNQTTGGVDNIQGTDGNDIIIGWTDTNNTAASTFYVGDIVDGKGGTDVLQLTFISCWAGGTVPPITVRNVEKFQLTGSGLGRTTLDTSAFTADDLSFESYYSTQPIEIRNIQQLADFYMTNTTADFYVGFSPSVVSGDNDSINLTLDSVGTKNNMPDFYTENVEKIVINSIGNSKNYLDEIASDDDGDLTAITGTSTLKELVIKGSQELYIDTALANTVQKIDASENTAGVEIDISNMIDTQDVDVKGGSGNDTFILGDASLLNNQDSIDLGDGTDDTIVVSNLGDLPITSISNVENLAIKQLGNINAADIMDISVISGIEKVIVKAYADDETASDPDTAIYGLTIDNSPNTVEFDYVNYTNNMRDTLDIDGDTDVMETLDYDGIHGAITINPAVANQDFTIIINNDPDAATGTVSAPTNGVDLSKGGVTLNNVSSVTINSIGGNLASDTTDVVDGKQENKINLTTSTNTVNITGDTDLEFQTASTTVKTINASEFTGNVAITANTAVAKTITTGSGNDFVNADVIGQVVNKGQTINTGAGNDWIKFEEANLTKADIIDGGDDIDTLVIADEVDTDDGDPKGTINWNTVTFTALNNASNLERLALDATNDPQTLNLNDNPLAAFNNDLTIVSYSVTSDNNYTINVSQVSNSSAAITVDFSNVTGNGTLTYTAGKNIDVVQGTPNDDTVTVWDANLGSNDIFDGGRGNDTFVLQVSGSGDSTDYTIITADDLKNIKSFETFQIQFETTNINQDYAKVIIDNDFAVNNQNVTTNQLTIDLTNLGKDYLIVDASDVEDVQLVVNVFNNKHITATLGSSNDTVDLNYGAAATASYSNLNINFGDGDEDTIEVEDGGAATTVDATGSTFSNFDIIKLDNNAQDLTFKIDADDVSGQSFKVIETGGDTKASTLDIEGASTGAGANDTIDLTKIDVNSDVDTITIHGNAGNDSITLSDVDFVNNNLTINIYGDAGNDSITGSKDADNIYGGLGTDTITTGDGNDKVILDSPFNAADKITDFDAGGATAAGAVDKIYIDVVGNNANTFGATNQLPSGVVTAASKKLFILTTSVGTQWKVTNNPSLTTNNFSNATINNAATIKKLFTGTTVKVSNNVGGGATDKLIVGAISLSKAATGNTTALLFFYDTDDKALQLIKVNWGAVAGGKVTGDFSISIKTIATVTYTNTLDATDILVF